MTALFNNPQPKHWIYIAILFTALFIISLLNGCKTREVGRSKFKAADKTETKTEVIKKDSVSGHVGKTDQLNTKTEIVKIDSNNNYTEIEVIYFKPDSVTPANSIFKTITKIRNNDVAKQISKLELNNLVESFANHSQIKTLDSNTVEKKDIVVNEDIKKVIAKDNTIRMWIGFAVFLIALGFALIMYFRYR